MTRGTLVILVAVLEHLSRVAVRTCFYPPLQPGCSHVTCIGAIEIGAAFLTATPSGLPEPYFPWGLCLLSEPQQPMTERAKGTRLGGVRAENFQ